MSIVAIKKLIYIFSQNVQQILTAVNPSTAIDLSGCVWTFVRPSVERILIVPRPIIIPSASVNQVIIIFFSSEPTL